MNRKWSSYENESEHLHYKAVSSVEYMTSEVVPLHGKVLHTQETVKIEAN